MKKKIFVLLILILMLLGLVFCANYIFTYINKVMEHDRVLLSNADSHSPDGFTEEQKPNANTTKDLAESIPEKVLDHDKFLLQILSIEYLLSDLIENLGKNDFHACLDCIKRLKNIGAIEHLSQNLEMIEQNLYFIVHAKEYELLLPKETYFFGWIKNFFIIESKNTQYATLKNTMMDLIIHLREELRALHQKHLQYISKDNIAIFNYYMQIRA